MEILLYIYLSGIIGSAGYGSYVCHRDNGTHFLTEGECHVASAIISPAWPVFVYGMVKEKFE